MAEQEQMFYVPFIGSIINANFNIPDQILDAYYSQVAQPLNKNQVSSAYVGKLNRYNSPYSVSVYGAYPTMPQWEMLEYKMSHCDEDHFKAYQRDTVFDYLKEFAKGFKNGYDNFINDKVTDGHLLSSNEASKAQAIMDFLSSPFGKFGFSETNDVSRHIFSGWFEEGMKAGYEYCAWIIIFKNHKLFAPYFKILPPIQVEVEAPTIARKDFTTPRHVLALHYIFEQLGIDDSEVDRTIKTEFAEFLTGKNNKNIYDAFQNPFVTKQKQFRYDDLQFIRTYFEKLGLSKIVKKINEQLEKPK